MITENNIHTLKMGLSKKEKIRLKEMIADLDTQIERLKIRRENYIEQLTLTDVSQLRESLIAFNIMLDYDIKRDSIEESVDYFLKNKWRYL